MVFGSVMKMVRLTAKGESDQNKCTKTDRNIIEANSNFNHHHHHHDDKRIIILAIRHRLPRRLQDKRPVNSLHVEGAGEDSPTPGC